ncbi:MAG: HlyD family efflux transporter periplasmic adaptor subunit [Cyanobacteria bacterium P01_D01_bin.36]
MNSEHLQSAHDFPTDSTNASSAASPKKWPSALRRQPRWVKYTLLSATGLLIAVGGVTSYQSLVGTPTETTTEQGSILPVEAATVEGVSSYRVPRTYTGEIVALRSSELGFERGGELTQVMAREGQRVNAGQTLASLDIRNLETQRLQVEAQRAQAIARLTELQNGARAEDIAAAEAEVRDLEQQLILQETQEQRREYLYERGAIAREQLDEFAYGANSLQAKLDQSRSRLAELQNGTRFEQIDAQNATVSQLDAQLEDIDVNISKSTITAPFDGIVAERRADEGTVIGTGQAVIELVEAAAPEAQIGVPASVVNQMQLGTLETIRINDQPYSAEVTAILPEVDQSTRTQTVVLELDSTAIGAIEPGQTARLTIEETIQADGFWLPRSALTQGIRGLWTCYVVVPANEYRELAEEGTFVEEPDATNEKTSTQGDYLVVEPRSVEIIQQQTTGDGPNTSTRVLVRGTLEPGDQVVTSGVHRLVPRQRVTAGLSE